METAVLFAFCVSSEERQVDVRGRCVLHSAREIFNQQHNSCSLARRDQHTTTAGRLVAVAVAVGWPSLHRQNSLHPCQNYNYYDATFSSNDSSHVYISPCVLVQ